MSGRQLQPDLSTNDKRLFHRRQIMKHYEKKLAALHMMLVHSMKCKQTVDLANVEALKKSAKEFHDLYLHD